MTLTKKEIWITVGATLVALLGSYIYYRKEMQIADAKANNIANAVTPSDLNDTLDIGSKIVAQTSAANLAQNLASTAGQNYLTYNTGNVVALNTGGTTGNGNSFTRGVPSELLVQQQINALIASNPILAPTASAVQMPQPQIDWNLIANPPLPN